MKIFSNRLGIKTESVKKKICENCKTEILVMGNVKEFKCPKCKEIIKEKEL
jgi:tRNA(Ile2) C34 agmatinyltransferase TiaS